VLGEQAVAERGLPGARRRRDDHQEARSDEGLDHALAKLPGERSRAQVIACGGRPAANRYSTFCTCSRSRSTSAFASTTRAAISARCDLLPIVFTSRSSSWMRK